MSDTSKQSSITQYGFTWGPVVVERMAHIEGRGYVISIRGEKPYIGQEIQVRVSEQGRRVTAYPMRGARVDSNQDSESA